MQTCVARSLCWHRSLVAAITSSPALGRACLFVCLCVRAPARVCVRRQAKPPTSQEGAGIQHVEFRRPVPVAVQPLPTAVHSVVDDGGGDDDGGGGWTYVGR